MSKIKDFFYDIEQMYIDGFAPTRIAKILDIPLGTVYDWLEDQNLMEQNFVAETQQEDSMANFG